jgi:FkbM family methyltransferase
MLRYIQSLGKGGSYVDVGGGFGNHSLFFAKFCKSNFVYTFEPNPVNANFAEGILALNGMQDKVAHSRNALASREGEFEATFTIRQNAPNATSIVNAIRMDDAVKANDVSVIKIDVEGAEMEVLRGASRILTECKPNLYIEALHEVAAKEYADFLSAFGYRATGNVFNASPTYEFTCD